MELLLPSGSCALRNEKDALKLENYTVSSLYAKNYNANVNQTCLGYPKHICRRVTMT
jgi:hypothetical protein